MQTIEGFWSFCEKKQALYVIVTSVYLNPDARVGVYEKKKKHMYQHNEKYVVAAAANVKRDVKSQFDKLNKWQCLRFWNLHMLYNTTTTTTKLKLNRKQYKYFVKKSKLQKERGILYTMNHNLTWIWLTTLSTFGKHWMRMSVRMMQRNEKK